jgi:hypothetical protein
MHAWQHAPALVERRAASWFKEWTAPAPRAHVVDRRRGQADASSSLGVGTGIIESVFIVAAQHERIHATADVERSAARRQDRIGGVPLPGMRP